MTFEQIIDQLDRLGLNLYDFALYTDHGIREHRFGFSDNCHNSYSVAKAFLMTAVGMLADEGRLQASDPVYPYFAEDFPPDFDPLWKNVRIEDALMHRVGFAHGFLDIDAEDVSAYPTDDYLRLVLAHPLAHRPGARYVYSDAAFYLLSRLVSKVTGERADSFLMRRLFRPMGFKEMAWSHCPMDYPMGATGLYVSAGDMVKLGALYLNGGVYGGKRYLSREWCALAESKPFELYPLGDGLIGKGGMYGQMVLYSPEKRFAAAWHSHERDGSADRILQVVRKIDRIDE